MNKPQSISKIQSLLSRNRLLIRYIVVGTAITIIIVIAVWTLQDRETILALSGCAAAASVFMLVKDKSFYRYTYIGYAIICTMIFAAYWVDGETIMEFHDTIIMALLMAILGGKLPAVANVLWKIERPLNQPIEQKVESSGERNEQ